MRSAVISGLPAEDATSNCVRQMEHIASRHSPVVIRVAKIPGFSETLEQSTAHLLGDDKNRHTVAGAAARTMAQCTIHPIDTIKTRLQISRPNVARLVAWKAAAARAHVLLQVRGRALLSAPNYAPFGVRDLYRGLSGAFVGTVPVALLYFAVYERVKPMLAKQSVPDTVAHITSAAAGAIASAVLRVPTDTVRHRTQAFLHPNAFAAVPQLLSSKGASGFYAGFKPTLMRDVPEIALQFASYECLRAIVQRRTGEELATWQHLLLGGISGAVAACATMPLDVLKTQMQCGGKGAARGGIVCALQRTLADKGPRGLFAGMGPRVAQTATMSAIFFTLFEFWKAQLKPLSQREGADRVLSQKLYRKKRKHIWKRQFSYR